MSFCAPNVENIKDYYTCFKKKELINIASTFNSYYNDKICKNKKCIIKKPIDIPNKSKRELWNSIYKRLKPLCKTEYCWLDLDFLEKIHNKDLRSKILHFTFKPKMTPKYNSWLNTNDIDAILLQYQRIYKDFKFVGALPSDFYKIQKVDYNSILQYKKIGIVFNLDAHYKSGSHWTAFLIDNKLKTLEYYDSVGVKPNRNIQKFINKVYKYLSLKGLDYTIKYNNIQHQFKNNECGVYSIHYIIKRLNGTSFEKITTNIITDKQMNKFRYRIFRPKK
jgi:hypothetical protein